LAQIGLTPFFFRCPYGCLSSGVFSGQGFQLFLADRIVSFEHVHRFVAACRHDPREAILLEPPIGL